MINPRQFSRAVAASDHSLFDRFAKQRQRARRRRILREMFGAFCVVLIVIVMMFGFEALRLITQP
jgi:hypothetical protein